MAGTDEIEAAVELAEAETGVARPGLKVRACATAAGRRGRAWSREENDFLQENLGRLSEADIAERLHRSSLAVHLHAKRDLHLCSPSKDPRILTGEHVAMGLGLDGKSVHRLMDGGLMPGRRLPTRGRAIRVVDRAAFLRWLCEPAHWLYFRIDRVGALRPRGKRGFTGVYDFAFWEDAREALLRARRGWGDEWLTPGQAAERLGYPEWVRAERYVNKAILRGTLRAKRWGNWWILKSDLPGPGMRFNVAGDVVPTGESRQSDAPCSGGANCRRRRARHKDRCPAAPAGRPRGRGGSAIGPQAQGREGTQGRVREEGPHRPAAPQALRQVPEGLK